MSEDLTTGGAWRVLHGDCCAVLPTLPAESVDAVVTDPPYHLTEGKRGGTGFMGQSWDGGDVAFRPETWAAVLRAAKPGAHLLAFGGTRTYHRLACAIEDAGWEVRDCLMWLYGSGFPKSHNIAAAIDRRHGHGPRAKAFNMKGRGGGRSEELDANGRTFLPPYEARTEEAREWQGWGTALKPSWEPIVLARKPLKGTVAANVAAFGTGALNIDACRVRSGDAPRKWENPRGMGFAGGADHGRCPSVENTDGRWPANLVLDDAAARLLDAQSGERAAGSPVRGTEPSGVTNGIYGEFAGRLPFAGHGDTGGASRFFYTAKAGDADRCGSKHPTVKPVALLRWLVRLVTPAGGVVLDPFAGSGTTGEAARLEGFRCVLVEREAEYVSDIRRRRESVECDLAGRLFHPATGEEVTA